jgi:hypothetical protein
MQKEKTLIKHPDYSGYFVCNIVYLVKTNTYYIVNGYISQWLFPSLVEFVTILPNPMDC